MEELNDLKQEIIKLRKDMDYLVSELSECNLKKDVSFENYNNYEMEDEETDNFPDI